MGWVWLFLWASVTVASLSPCEQAVVQAAEAALNDPRSLRATWAMNISRLVVPGDSLKSVFAHLPNTFVTPASNNKMPTTAAAFLKVETSLVFFPPLLLLLLTLLQFGPDHSFTTELLLSNDGSNELCLVASGAPDLDHDQLAQLVFNASSSLNPAQVYSLQLDNTLFGPQSVPGDWEWDDMNYYYGAFPVPSVLDENVVFLRVIPGVRPGLPAVVSFAFATDYGTLLWDNSIVTVGAGEETSIDFGYDASNPQTLVLTGTIALDSDDVLLNPAVHAPAKRLMVAFVNQLARANISVSVLSYGACGASSGSLIGQVSSAPLRVLMNHTLKESDNLYAELFMRHLGTLNSQMDNYDSGIAYVQQSMSNIGADASGFHQADGCGLGRMNLLTTSAVVSLLVPMRDTEWVSYLPVGGESGTLADRYVGTVAQGRIKAKTGTLTGVNSLSGYVYPVSNTSSHFLFSIICNGTPDSHSAEIHALVDPIVVAMAKC